MKLIVFDLDGTLTASKQRVDPEMAQLFTELLTRNKIAIVSGGKFEQFKEQFLEGIYPSEDDLQNLVLFPTNGTQCRIYNQRKKLWEKKYDYPLEPEQKARIRNAFKTIFYELSIQKPKQLWGEQFEDRGGQITYSALGQEAPLDVKKEYDPDQKKRSRIADRLKQLLPDYEIAIGGTTSIDVTKKGVNKAYAIKQILTHFKASQNDVLYIGDALYPSGNDAPVKLTGVQTQSVEGIADTRKLIRGILDGNS